MRTFNTLLVAGLIAAASAAQASGTDPVSGVTAVGSASYKFPGSQPQYEGPKTTTTNLVIQNQVNNSKNNSYVNYQVNDTISPSSIDFQNGATAEGGTSSVTSSSSINFTLNNTTGKSFSDVTLTASIVKAGFGFYVGDPAANTELASDINLTLPNTGVSFSDFKKNSGSGSNGSVLATARFLVTISDTNKGTLETLSGTATLLKGGVVTFDPTTLALLHPTVTMNGSELLISWNPTNVVLSLGAIAEGGSDTITYNTTVMALTNATDKSCEAALCPDIVAYSGFGDPIGTSGGIKPGALTELPGSGASFIDQSRVLGTGGGLEPITNVFRLSGINDNGQAGFTIGVPEPASWALMLVGVGFIGATLRRRAARLAA